MNHSALLPRRLLHFSVPPVYDAPFLVLSEIGERKVYRLAHCIGGVLDSGAFPQVH